MSANLGSARSCVQGIRRIGDINGSYPRPSPRIALGNPRAPLFPDRRGVRQLQPRRRVPAHLAAGGEPANPQARGGARPRALQAARSWGESHRRRPHPAGAQPGGTPPARADQGRDQGRQQHRSLRRDFLRSAAGRRLFPGAGAGGALWRRVPERVPEDRRRLQRLYPRVAGARPGGSRLRARSAAAARLRGGAADPRAGVSRGQGGRRRVPAKLDRHRRSGGAAAAAAEPPQRLAAAPGQLGRAEGHLAQHQTRGRRPHRDPRARATGYRRDTPDPRRLRRGPTPWRGRGRTVPPARLLAPGPGRAGAGPALGGGDGIHPDVARGDAGARGVGRMARESARCAVIGG